MFECDPEILDPELLAARVREARRAHAAPEGAGDPLARLAEHATRLEIDGAVPPPPILAGRWRLGGLAKALRRLWRLAGRWDAEPRWSAQRAANRAAARALWEAHAALEALTRRLAEAEARLAALEQPPPGGR